MVFSYSLAVKPMRHILTSVIGGAKTHRLFILIAVLLLSRRDHVPEIPPARPKWVR